jgi:hypothetical protein
MMIGTLLFTLVVNGRMKLLRSPALIMVITDFFFPFLFSFFFKLFKREKSTISSDNDLCTVRICYSRALRSFQNETKIKKYYLRTEFVFFSESIQHS